MFQIVCVAILQLDRLGLPIGKYFKFLKFAAWLMVAALLVSIPNVLLFREGGLYVPSDAEDYVPFVPFEHGRFHDSEGRSSRPVHAATYIDVKRSVAVVSLGNLLALPDNVTAYTAFTSIGINLPLRSSNFAVAVAIVASAAGLICLAGVLWYWWSDIASSVRDTWNAYGTVTIEEYSVAVTNLPKFVTREELKSHLELVRSGVVEIEPENLMCRSVFKFQHCAGYTGKHS